MIKVIKAHENLAEPDMNIPASVSVLLDIDGYWWYQGGIPANWDKAQIIAYLRLNETDWLRQAKQRGQLDKPELAPKERLDLLDIKPRDLESELDDLKVKVGKLEASQKKEV